MNALTLHLWVGTAVVVLAVVAAWRPPLRRIALYAITLQIAIGIVLAFQVNAPWYHYALAVIAWGGFMAAGALSRREHADRNVQLVLTISTLLLVIAYYVGQHAVKAGGAS